MLGHRHTVVHTKAGGQAVEQEAFSGVGVGPPIGFIHGVLSRRDDPRAPYLSRGSQPPSGETPQEVRKEELGVEDVGPDLSHQPSKTKEGSRKVPPPLKVKGMDRDPQGFHLAPEVLSRQEEGHVAFDPFLREVGEVVHEAALGPPSSEGLDDIQDHDLFVPSGTGRGTPVRKGDSCLKCAQGRMAAAAGGIGGESII
jgi:hypothetical protein